MSSKPTNRYSAMQKWRMSQQAQKWEAGTELAEPGSIHLSNLEAGVGNFHDHNNWSDYQEFLFGGFETKDKVMLDFACGPGRNIVRFNDQFSRIDGVDLSKSMLVNARKWLEQNRITEEQVTLYLNNGSDIRDIPGDHYDFVMSTIALQHIAVHKIRFNIFKDFFRILKKGGWITLQMAYGVDHPNSVTYFDDAWTAKGTNRSCDVRIEDPSEPKKDLDAIGFENFEYWIRPAVPGSDARRGGNSIFFRAQKPLTTRVANEESEDFRDAYSKIRYFFRS
jgi:ubiquinone/menaquinone biosynthesis C-methylase UbiE